jgi:hypothetical protein
MVRQRRDEDKNHQQELLKEFDAAVISCLPPMHAGIFDIPAVTTCFRSLELANRCKYGSAVSSGSCSRLLKRGMTRSASASSRCGMSKKECKQKAKAPTLDRRKSGSKRQRRLPLCLLAFAQHAGQEYLRRYNMEITGAEHVDNRLSAETPNEVTGLDNLRSSDRYNLEQCAPTIAFVVQENCALKNQLQILKHRGDDHLRNEISFLESSMQQRQLKHKDLCSLLNSSLQPQPQQPPLKKEAKGGEGTRAYAGYPPSSPFAIP